MANDTKSKRKAQLSSASKVLQTLLANGKSPLSDQFLRWKIWRFWGQIVGPTLASSCEPVHFDRGRLYIWVRSSARLQELRFLEETVRKKINDHVGREWARSLRLTLDRQGVPKASDVSEEFKKYLDQNGGSGPEVE